MSNRPQSQSKCCCSACGAQSFQWYRDVKQAKGVKCRRCGGRVKLAREVENAADLESRFLESVRVPVPSQRIRLHSATPTKRPATSEQAEAPSELQQQPSDDASESTTVPPITTPMRGVRQRKESPGWTMTGQCVVPFGRYCGKRLADVPLSYLIALSQGLPPGKYSVGGVDFKNELQRYLRNLP